MQDWSEANDCKWVKPLMLNLAKYQLLPGMLGVYPWPSEYYHLSSLFLIILSYTDIKPPCGIAVDEWDPFHELIVQDELARCGAGGVMLGLAGIIYLMFLFC